MDCEYDAIVCHLRGVFSIFVYILNETFALALKTTENGNKF